VSARCETELPMTPMSETESWRQAIEDLVHGDAAPGAATRRGPLLAQNTMDTRAEREESHEWRDWAERFTHLRVRGYPAYRSSAPSSREPGKCTGHCRARSVHAVARLTATLSPGEASLPEYTYAVHEEIATHRGAALSTSPADVDAAQRAGETRAARPRTRGGGGFAVAETAVLDKLVSAALEKLGFQDRDFGAAINDWNAGGAGDEAEVLRWESEDEGTPGEEVFCRGKLMGTRGSANDEDRRGRLGDEGDGHNMAEEESAGASGSAALRVWGQPAQGMDGGLAAAPYSTYSTLGSTPAAALSPAHVRSCGGFDDGYGDSLWATDDDADGGAGMAGEGGVAGGGGGAARRTRGLAGLRRGRAPLSTGPSAWGDRGGGGKGLGRFSSHKDGPGGIARLAVSMEWSMRGVGQGGRGDSCGGSGGRAGGGGRAGAGGGSSRRPASGMFGV